MFYKEHFGYLIGCYLIETDKRGQLLTSYQKIVPELKNEFAEFLDENDHRLIDLLNEISLSQLYKHFGNNEPSFQHFIEKYKNQWDYILEYIQKRLLLALPLLKDKPFFLMHRDGYPAWKSLAFHPATASLEFILRRKEEEVYNSISIKLGGKPIDVQNITTALITRKPAWILHGNQVFTFDQEVDGKKIAVFFSKPSILIAKTKQPLPQKTKNYLIDLVEHYTVHAEGISFKEIRAFPQFELLVSKDSQNIYTFRLVAIYEGISLNVDRKQAITCKIEENLEKGEFSIVKIFRNPELEKEKIEQFEQWTEGRSLLFDFSCSEPLALQWLLENNKKIKAAGIVLKQDFEEGNINLCEPVLEQQVVEVEGGYELKAQIHFGEHVVPFASIRNNVLKNNPKFQLPNGEVVLLPASWLQDFRHFFEVAVPSEGGLRLRKYQGALLENVCQQKNIFTWQALQDFTAIEKQPLPQGLRGELRDYQYEGYNWLCYLKKYGLGGILADDMGLGKTLQVLTLLLREKEQNNTKPSLIVVPNSLIFNWGEEAKKFTPQLRILVYTGSHRHRLLEKFRNYDIILTTYGTVRKDEELLVKQNFHYVILDESQMIKNKDSQTTQAVFSLNADFRLSITGTPIENSTMDLWSQMHFVNPGILGTEDFFQKFYAIPIEKERNQARAERLKALIHPFILRRTKEMVAAELPPCQENIIYCEMLPSQLRLYNQTKQFYRSTLFSEDQDEEALKKNKFQILSSLQRLRQIAIHPSLIDPRVSDSGKYDELKEMLKTVLAEGRKVLIFSQFVKLLTIIKYDLIMQKIKFCIIDGSVKDRAREVKLFQEDPEYKVFLISLRAGGVGLTLTAAEYVFILDPWWNPAVEQQAMNRAYRIGQTKPVFVYKFITRNSIEEKILNLQTFKAQLAKDIIKSEASFFKTLSKEDFISLFE
ncbi:MAG: DEAD/DEAH box helicase [Bacteroidia bacterium]|nr:DEAD/DEAH box helicase [Bacteroidia bacterium]